MSARQAVRILFNAPSRLAEASYALGELSLRIGMPLDFVMSADGAAVHAVYGPSRSELGVPCIPFDESCYQDATECHPAGMPVLWAPAGTPPESVDLIGGVFRLLTLLDERGIAETSRNSRGIFFTDALPAGRRQVLADPLVENHAAALRSLLHRGADLPPPTPLWPDNYQWAVLLTHDTDALNIGSPKEILFNAVKAVARRDEVRVQMARNGWRMRHKAPHENPLFGFSGWRKITTARGTRSAFYLYARGRVPPTLNDCRSDVTHPLMDWDLLREMAADGCEFGLHAPIRAKESIDEFLWGKQFMEQRLGQPIFGLRHHYWALDWRSPYLTYRMHVNAGFRYDLSMAWRDSPGLRPGSCLPYQPFDPGRMRALDIYSVPTLLMDAHVIQPAYSLENAVDRAIDAIDGVRRVGGIACLDWHTESACNDYTYSGYRTVLEKIIDRIAEAGDAWITTPWQLIQHWHLRRRALVGGSGSEQ
jgi:peptidoglycan/xylan/chitin deacetylase (PgdA/CDA1 family)